MTVTLDAITLSVIQASLQQACDEMDLTFSRAAFSPVIAEAENPPGTEPPISGQ